MSAGKKSTSYPTFFSGYCKDMQTSYFGFFGHVWLNTSKMTVTTCNFICMPNINFIIYFFLEILHSSIWLGFWLTWESEFCQIWDWWWNVKTITISFHFRLIPEKTKAKIFWKLQNTLFWAHFCPFCPNLSKNKFSWKKGSVSF